MCVLWLMSFTTTRRVTCKYTPFWYLGSRNHLTRAHKTRTDRMNTKRKPKQRANNNFRIILLFFLLAYNWDRLRDSTLCTKKSVSLNRKWIFGPKISVVITVWLFSKTFFVRPFRRLTICLGDMRINIITAVTVSILLFLLYSISIVPYLALTLAIMWALFSLCQWKSAHKKPKW